MKYIFVFTMLLFLSSCSTLSRNLVKKGEFFLRNGSYKGETWDENLEFERRSWYHELTLYFDFMWSEIDEKSPFYKWFSDGGKRTVQSCEKFYIATSYSLDEDKIGHSEFFDHLEDAGYEKVTINTFKSYVQLHPDYQELSLSHYKLYGLCRKEGAKDKVEITFPNYPVITFP